jgi:hypothetical protein
MNDDVFAKPVSVRGPNGRFVSKKIIALEDTPNESQPSEMLDGSFDQHPTFYDDLSFYGQAIRRIHHNGEWYYAVEDLLPLIQITTPSECIKELQSETFYKHLLNEHFFEITSESRISQALPLIVGNKTAILELVSYFRSLGRIFPGPFLNWINSTSLVSLQEQQERISLKNTAADSN